MAKPAARKSDPSSCPLPGHGTNPIATGSPDVFFDGLPAARLGDTYTCGSALSSGLATTVFINGKNAATIDTAGSHGSIVIGGSGTVIIGDSHTLCGPGAPICAIAVVLLGSTAGGIAGSIVADSLDDELEEFSHWDIF